MWWESHLIPWVWVVFFFPWEFGALFFFFFFILFPLNFFSPPSPLSFLLIRLCWGAVSIQKQKAPRRVFFQVRLGEGRGGGESRGA